MTRQAGAAGGEPAEVRALLRRYGLTPDKRLGQNFLIERGALDMVVASADLDASDRVLEIGAGLGSLTVRLATVVSQVVAVEVDRRLLQALTEVVRPFPNVQIVQADILRADLVQLTGGNPFRVVANIPYAITSLLLRRLMEMPQGPDRVVLTLQKEVVERVVAGPGAMSLLALSVQVYGRPQLMARIPAASFYPAPQVDSAVLRIDRHAEPAVAPGVIGPLFEVARAGFQQRRKQLRNALASGLGVTAQAAEAWLQEAGIPPEARAQELDLAQWERLARAAQSLRA